MDLFIQMKNGVPYEHPIFGDNFRQVFPHIDIENLPPAFAKFERIPKPSTQEYETVDGPEYVLQEDGVVRDVWTIRPMTQEEIESYNAIKFSALINSSIGVTHV